MDLAELNRRVTSAIFDAEALAHGSWEAQCAFRTVSELEEEIATMAGAGTVEGDIARLGALTAALSAGEPLRALQLGERYGADSLSDGARARLAQLLAEAEAELARHAAEAPDVVPIRFKLREDLR
jgi:hypothetical protein